MYLSHYQPIVSISFSNLEKTIFLIMTDITRVNKYCAFPTIYTDLNQSWAEPHSCLVWEKVSTDIWSPDWSISLAFLCLAPLQQFCMVYPLLLSLLTQVIFIQRSCFNWSGSFAINVHANLLLYH